MTSDPTAEPGGELVLYQAEDGRTRIQVRFDQGSIWLSQAQLADLYQTSIPNVSQHIRNVLEEGELRAEATVKDYLTVRVEGSRQVQRAVQHYNLDMVLAVGYRVRSERGAAFSQWATSRLGECLVNRLTTDDERLKNPGAGICTTVLPFQSLEHVDEPRLSPLFVANSSPDNVSGGPGAMGPHIEGLLCIL